MPAPAQPRNISMCFHSPSLLVLGRILLIPTAVDFNKLVDKFNADAVQSDVYTVDKIHKSRVRGAVAEYQVTWKGYSKRHKTWEPEPHLLDYSHGPVIRRNVL